MTDELRKLAEAATPLDLSTAQKFRDGEYIECPVCNGEGGIDAKDYCNIDGHAIGVQIYGIGEKMVAMENFVKAANPTAVIALLDEITALRAKVKRQAEAAQDLVDIIDRRLPHHFISLSEADKINEAKDLFRHRAAQEATDE